MMLHGKQGVVVDDLGVSVGCHSQVSSATSTAKTAKAAGRADSNRTTVTPAIMPKNNTAAATCALVMSKE
jgi:hypothetical protein